MTHDRLPNKVFNIELVDGKQKRGGQKLPFKDVLKCHMKYTEVDADAWEQTASSRSIWLNVLHQTIKRVEEKGAADYLCAYARRQSVPSASDFSCEKCKRSCRSRAGLAAQLRACKNKPT